MKRLLTTALTLTVLLTPAPALAQPKEPITALESLFKTTSPFYEQPSLVVAPEKPKAAPVEPAKPAPVVYTVVEGDNLTKIGTAHSVEWQRLWAKNTQLVHPDTINVGELIKIPLADEQLTRELPAIVNLPIATPGVPSTPQTPSEPHRAPAPVANFGGGNTYDYGYCTWYVKNRRGASIPNSLGNANTWYYRAQAAGMAVGSTPRAGAVGTTTRGSLGHVVYVESVNSDGTVNISEMNYKGFGVTSSRTTSASEFLYIY